MHGFTGRHMLPAVSLRRLELVSCNAIAPGFNLSQAYPSLEVLALTDLVSEPAWHVKDCQRMLDTAPSSLRSPELEATKEAFDHKSLTLVIKFPLKRLILRGIDLAKTKACVVFYAGFGGALRRVELPSLDHKDELELVGLENPDAVEWRKL